MKKILIIAAPAVFILIVSLLIAGKKHISTEITINAPADTIWNILIDFNKYPEWNPFIRKAAGNIQEGRTIEVTFQTKDRAPIVFTPEIILNKQHSTLQWEGKLLMPGIFTGRHTFQLVPVDRNTTRLIQKEDFNGILVPFFNYDSTIEGFTSMNHALKKRAETKR